MEFCESILIICVSDVILIFFVCGAGDWAQLALNLGIF
jgi:hypothetical protein